MSQANITVELPGCGGQAIIRGFVKNKDRKVVQRVLLASKEYKQSDLTAKDGGEIEITVAGSDLMDVTGVQAKCLLISYDGNTDNPYDAMLESEYEQDMKAVEEAASGVFKEASEKLAKK